MISRWLVLLVYIGFSGYTLVGNAAPADDARQKCAALAQTDFSGIEDAPAQVTQAKLVDATSDSPAHCQVSGYVTPNVGFSLSLPTTWNSKFMHIGCGGFCGATSEKPSAHCKGYACISSDMGHKGVGDDGLWANLQTKVDWSYRATHVATLAGKSITERYYTQAPKRSYFMGCSTGGRQALVTAQRFPWDFDGIVAAAPPVHQADLLLMFAWNYRALRDESGKPLLSKEQLGWVTAAAVAKCDLDDGVKDGVIGDPIHCAFDPAQLACKSGAGDRCLAETQVAAVRKIYAGPMNSRGEKLTPGGLLPGAEVDSLSGLLVEGWG